MAKTIQARVLQKTDTEANWNKATTFIPKLGELIIYSKDSTYNHPRFKVGDGSTTVVNLPFTEPFTTQTSTSTNTTFTLNYTNNYKTFTYTPASNASLTLNATQANYPQDYNVDVDITMTRSGCNTVNLTLSATSLDILVKNCPFLHSGSWTIGNTTNTVGTITNNTLKLTLPNDKDSSGNYLVNTMYVKLKLRYGFGKLTLDPEIYF